MNIHLDLQQMICSDVLPGTELDGVAVDEPLISSGKVDSLGLLQILSFIHTRYGVDIMSHGEPKDFDSVAAMVAAIRRARGEE